VDDEDGLGKAGPSPKEHPMAKRIPASMRTREALQALIEGRLASPAGRSELVALATRPIVEEAQGEVRDALDRGCYESGEAPGQAIATATEPSA
jgi:hypothetical protein